MSFVTKTIVGSLIPNKRDDDMPAATTEKASKSGDMPSMSSGGMPSISSSSELFSTPSVTVPPSNHNPYIHRETRLTGTVFIAVGSVVGAIILAFVLFHLIRSIRASMLAKKSFRNEKTMYERYDRNNHMFRYSVGSSSTQLLNNEYHGSVTKIPLMSTKSIYDGDASTLHMSETPYATSHHDLTSMFVSPTKEVMTHGRSRSVTNILGGTNLSLRNNEPTPAINRHSQVIPNMYLSPGFNNSEYSLLDHVGEGGNSGKSSSNSPDNSPNPRAKRKTIPSTYLEDLIDK